jgi:thioredoxin-related protein
MHLRMKRLLLLLGLLLCVNITVAAPGVTVVYPDWFKQSLFDLPGDMQDARDAGKRGIALFVSMKTCSYCKAMIETTFQQDDIVKRLRAGYDVIGIEVFSDAEVVDLQGKTHWSKDFAVQEKATFTPTMLFYGTDGKLQLRLVGYQSPDKFRSVLDYLEQGQYSRMTLRDFMQQGKPAAAVASAQTAALNLDRRTASDRYLLVIFESADCAKCGQLRTMLKAPVLQPYLRRLQLVFLSSTDDKAPLITPDGKQQTAKTWASQLGLTYSPAMVFFDEQGNEAVRVDTDILIDPYGKDIADDDARILDNIRARLQFVLDKGYVTLPQFQRWRSQQSRHHLR